MKAIVFILAGAYLGLRRPQVLAGLERFYSRALDTLLLVLVASSSLSFGLDPVVSVSLASIGFTSIFTALAVLSVSVLAALAWVKLSGTLLPDQTLHREPEAPSETNPSVSPKAMSVLIASSVVFGWALGLAVQKTADAGLNLEQLQTTVQTLASCALWMLLVVIGYEMGRQRVWNDMKRHGLWAVTLPLTVGLASLAGACLATPCLDVNLKESLAAGAGFGWYSLAGGMAMNFGGPRLGAFVFLSNILREVLTIVSLPFLQGKIPAQAAAAMGGATSMDSSLGAISKSFGSHGTLWGIIVGTTLSMLCPIVMGLILQM